MRISRYLLLLLAVGFSTVTPVCAETAIYFRGQPLFVPPSIVLLVGGLALLALGSWVLKLYRG
jgi:hypothetical protein